MQSLNFPAYQFRFKNSENKVHIFDPVRKKFVLLQPEEWVRQHVLQYLVHDRNYPLSHINVEKLLRLNSMVKRYDIVVYDPDGQIAVLVECKAPASPLSQLVFDQIARYNFELRARYLMLTNGLQHVYCAMDYEAGKYTFLSQLPGYQTPGASPDGHTGKF